MVNFMDSIFFKATATPGEIHLSDMVMIALIVFESLRGVGC